jgi:hypothetical protein
MGGISVVPNIVDNPESAGDVQTDGVRFLSFRDLLQCFDQGVGLDGRPKLGDWPRGRFLEQAEGGFAEPPPPSTALRRKPPA